MPGGVLGSCRKAPPRYRFPSTSSVVNAVRSPKLAGRFPSVQKSRFSTCAWLAYVEECILLACLHDVSCSFVGIGRKMCL